MRAYLEKHPKEAEEINLNINDFPFYEVVTEVIHSYIKEKKCQNMLILGSDTAQEVFKDELILDIHFSDLNQKELNQVEIAMNAINRDRFKNLLNEDQDIIDTNKQLFKELQSQQFDTEILSSASLDFFVNRNDGKVIDPKYALDIAQELGLALEYVEQEIERLNKIYWQQAEHKDVDMKNVNQQLFNVLQDKDFDTILVASTSLSVFVHRNGGRIIHPRYASDIAQELELDSEDVEQEIERLNNLHQLDTMMIYAEEAAEYMFEDGPWINKRKEMFTLPKKVKIGKRYPMQKVCQNFLAAYSLEE
jgi:hypothetical protein